MTTTRHGAAGLDLLCQHEFDDRALCAATAVPGSTRCVGHLDDGQPAVEVTPPSAPSAPARSTAKAGA